MIVPSRRTLGAAALIAAGIGAFLVPFLLHSPSTQSTSPTPTTPGSGGKNPTTPSGSSGGDNSSSGGSTGGGKPPPTMPPVQGKREDKGKPLCVVKKKKGFRTSFLKCSRKRLPSFHFYQPT